MFNDRSFYQTLRNEGSQMTFDSSDSQFLRLWYTFILTIFIIPFIERYAHMFLPFYTEIYVFDIPYSYKTIPFFFH